MERADGLADVEGGDTGGWVGDVAGLTGFCLAAAAARASIFAFVLWMGLFFAELDVDDDRGGARVVRVRWVGGWWLDALQGCDAPGAKPRSLFYASPEVDRRKSGGRRAVSWGVSWVLESLGVAQAGKRKMFSVRAVLEQMCFRPGERRVRHCRYEAIGER